MMPLRRPPRRGFINWSFPLSLFRGSVGAWLDINSLFRLFTTAAGSTQAAAITDPVGRAEAIVGTNALNATDTQRPILKTLPSGRYCLYHDRVDDKLTLANMPAGTYTVGFSSFAGIQIYNILQSSLGTLSIPVVDYTEALIINRVLTASETNQLRTYLASKAEPVGKTDVLRVYCSSSSVNLSITESGGSSGATWELGDGQTASGTSCVKTITAPQSVVLRAADKTKIDVIYFGSKNIFGQLDLTQNVNLIDAQFYSNQFSGALDLTKNVNLIYARFHTNQFSGVLDLTKNVNLISAQFYNNQFSGALYLTQNVNLITAYFYNNKFSGALDLTQNVNLITAWFYNNKFSGALDLTQNVNLTVAYFYDNQFSGFTGTVSNSIGEFLAENNLFTSSAVNSILAEFVAAGRNSGTRILNVGGTGNAAPTGQGITDKATLQSRGWTVITN